MTLLIYMLTSLQNPLIKEIRKLHQSKFRHQQQRLILEGNNLLVGALEVGYPLETCCATPQWQAKYPQIWTKLAAASQKMVQVSPEVLKAIATTVNPEGIVATAVRQPALIPQPYPNLGLIVDRLQDPGNLGTIIRTGVATGMDGLWLSQDSVDFDHPKVLRASAGAWFKLPMATSRNLLELIVNFQQQGIQVIATLPEAQQSYWDLDLTQPSIILLGNEGGGLTPELKAMATQTAKIPMQKSVESLNVAISAALLLYEARRQLSISNGS